MRPAVILLACCACAAANAATYQFVGPKFATTGGSGYTTSMQIVGSFTTADPLPANMPLTDIGPLGNGLATAWSFSDGVNTFTQSNSGPYAALLKNFRVATNAAGRISVFSFKLMSPISSATPVGATAKVLTFNSLPESRGENGGTCSLAFGGFCRSIMDGPNFGVAQSSPVVDVDGDGHADALTDGLLLLRFMFGLRNLPLVQNVLAPGATRTTVADIENWLTIYTNAPSP